MMRSFGTLTQNSKLLCGYPHCWVRSLVVLRNDVASVLSFPTGGKLRLLAAVEMFRPTSREPYAQSTLTTTDILLD
jgi:hypothetical protein